MNIGGYALVTGAGMQSFSRIHPTDRPPLTSLRSGIGLTCAQRYAEKNAADVAFADLDLRTAERAAEESLGLMTNPDYRAIFIRVDVTQETDVEDMVKETRKEFGRIDHAVNCAGVNLVARVKVFAAAASSADGIEPWSRSRQRPKEKLPNKPPPTWTT